MIILNHTLLSDDILDQRFCCDIQKCKGACCIEGDKGAPLDEAEIGLIEEILPQILPILDPDAVQRISEMGFYEVDDDGEPVTQCLNDGRCVFVNREKEGHLSCAMEKAYNQGLTTFRKPISCHLYPIRLSKTDTYTALNYHEWSICSAACSLGDKLDLPLYRFGKEALVRKFGEDWYRGVEALADDKLNSGS